MHYKEILIILPILYISVKPDCAFSQTCKRSLIPNPNNQNQLILTGCQQVNVPTKYDGPATVNSPTAQQVLTKVCPDYSNGDPTCCNDDQVDILDSNFSSIEALFGYCPLCSKNLKQFWCNFTCDPNQSKAVNVTGTSISPSGPVLDLDLKVQPQMSCNIWQACKKIPFASEVSTSADAFMQFMGINAQTTGKTLINIDFVDEPEAVFTKSTPCEFVVPPSGEIDGYKNLSNCTCTYCENRCSVGKVPQFPQFFDGFDWVLVVIVYAVLLVLSILIFLIKWKCGNNKNQVDRNSSRLQKSQISSSSSSVGPNTIVAAGTGNI